MMQTSTTPVPNSLFDFHLKNLKSAELKVLLIVIRQTLGWSDKREVNGRKERDWIAGSQLQSKTGCSRRALSSATDALIKKCLIQILDEKGNILENPEKRQGKTKLYYRLDLRMYYPVEKEVSIKPTSAKFAKDMSKKVTALVQKMRITKETLQN
jgi:hypothetical protein